MKRICSAAGCKKAAINEGRCDKHPRKNRSTTTAHKNIDNAGKNVHNSSRWKRLSKLKRSMNPLCEICLADNIAVPSTEVDHIKPIDTNPHLAYDLNNLQALCHSCHMKKTHKDKQDKRK